MIKEDPKATCEVKSWCLTVIETYRHANSAYGQHRHPHTTPSRSPLQSYWNPHIQAPPLLPTLPQEAYPLLLQLGEVPPRAHSREPGPLQNGD